MIRIPNSRKQAHLVWFEPWHIKIEQQIGHHRSHGQARTKSEEHENE